MSGLVKQHLIDPEVCIRCYTCEMTCPIQAIQHDDQNVVVDAEICNFCMDCVPVCPTGSIDEWRVVRAPYSLAAQFGWDELPAQESFETAESAAVEALDTAIADLLAEAHQGAGGATRAPASAAKPSVNLHPMARPATATVVENRRLTAGAAHEDVRHIVLDFEATPFAVLEGQSVGVIAPGETVDSPHLPRLYSVSSPRDGEQPNANTIALTVKREAGGVCSNYLCDLAAGDSVRVTGPFGATFLMPDDPTARLLMICTGTGAAPFRAFTMRRQRATADAAGDMTLFFGGRTPETLPYYRALETVPDEVLAKHLVFSRLPNSEKEYVQDRLLTERARVAEMLGDPKTHVYICGLRAMEAGVENALASISEGAGQAWPTLRDSLRDEGRYHVETY